MEKKGNTQPIFSIKCSNQKSMTISMVLEEKNQSLIFQLQTGHARINSHLNHINLQFALLVDIVLTVMNPSNALSSNALSFSNVRENYYTHSSSYELTLQDPSTTAVNLYLHQSDIGLRKKNNSKLKIYTYFCFPHPCITSFSD